MHRLLRQFLIALLALTLPVMGWASMAMPKACRTHQTVAAASGHETCGEHAQSSSDHHQAASPCKSGAQCCMTLLWASAGPALALTWPPRATLDSLHHFPRFAAAIPAAVWRPPQA